MFRAYLKIRTDTPNTERPSNFGSAPGPINLSSADGSPFTIYNTFAFN